MHIEVRIDATGDLCSHVRVFSLCQRIGKTPTCRDGGQDNDEPLRQAPSRSLRPTGRRRVSTRDRADRSISRHPDHADASPNIRVRPDPRTHNTKYSLPDALERRQSSAERFLFVCQGLRCGGFGRALVGPSTRRGLGRSVGCRVREWLSPKCRCSGFSRPRWSLRVVPDCPPGPASSLAARAGRRRRGVGRRRC